MAKNRMDLLELLRKRGLDGDVDFVREALRVLVEGIMDAEVSAQVRRPAWRTQPGTTHPPQRLSQPRLGHPGGDDGVEDSQGQRGELFPQPIGTQATQRENPAGRDPAGLPFGRLRTGVEGVSTRRVDDLFKSLGGDGISKPVLSRPKGVRDRASVRNWTRWWRPSWASHWTVDPYPYVWLDALTQEVREGGRIVNVSVVVATGVNAQGQREVLGTDVGASEDGAFWLAFLRSLNARGLSGVELVASDAHQGLKQAIATVFADTSWQRCRTHFMVNLLTRVPKRSLLSLPKGRAWPPWCAPSTNSSPQRRSTPRRSGGQLNSGSTSHRLLRCWKTPCPTPWPSPPSRCPTGRNSGPTIHWNG